MHLLTPEQDLQRLQQQQELNSSHVFVANCPCMFFRQKHATVPKNSNTSMRTSACFFIKNMLEPQKHRIQPKNFHASAPKKPNFSHLHVFVKKTCKRPKKHRISATCMFLSKKHASHMATHHNPKRAKLRVWARKHTPGCLLAVAVGLQEHRLSNSAHCLEEEFEPNNGPIMDQ